MLSNATVVAWGDNSFGQTNIPAGLSNVIAIAAGDFHTLALKVDGAVVAWGDDTYGQIDVPLLSTHVVGVASGYYHSMALLAVPFLRCHRTASGLVMQWNDPAVLQWSATVNGPFSDIPNVAGNYTNTDFSLPAKFFRLRW